jgi:hypothetical protein
VVAVVVAGAVTLAAAGPSSAANKGFAAGWRVGGATVATASVPAGSSSTLTLRLTNTSTSPQAFGSSNITIPAGFTIVGASVPSPGSVTAPTNSNPVRVRNVNVRPRSSIDVSLTVRASCLATPTGTVSILVKQSNDFNGTGNDFTLDGPLPTLSVAGSCSLAFDPTRQPAETAANAVITSVAYTPDAAARVRVRALDGTGALLTTYTGQVTLSIGQPSPTSTLLGGTIQANAVGGLVEFSPTINTPSPISGPLYKLRASATNFTSGDSAEFRIGFGAIRDCAIEGQICSTGDFASPSGNTANVTLNDADSVNGRIVAKYTGATFTCPEYTPTSDLLDFNVLSAQDLSGLTKTISITQPVQPGKPNATDYQVCFQAPYDFPALRISELLADFSAWDFSNNTVVSGTAPDLKYTGLLLPCDAGLGVPCVEERTISSGTITVKFKTKAADPAAWV